VKPDSVQAAGDRGSGTMSDQHSREISSLVEKVMEGDLRALARSISLIEDGSADLSDIMRSAGATATMAPIVGITGPSGAGKSSLVDALVACYRRSGVTVGVLAVDPTSPLTGGALLGDRVRMNRHSGDVGVFVRSMATRGALGGLAAAAYDALVLMTAAGFDRLIVETVGVGQDEVDVAGVADTTCVVLTPGAGDEVQAIKAGILEVGDIFVLNKADLAGADQAEAQLRAWVAGAQDEAWPPPVLRTVATSEEGVEDLHAAVEHHSTWLRSSGEASLKRRALARLRLRSLLRDRLFRMARACGFDHAREAELVDAIASGDLGAHGAVEQIIADMSMSKEQS
jgi:LAO/AO transport system kinase